MKFSAKQQKLALIGIIIFLIIGPFVIYENTGERAEFKHKQQKLKEDLDNALHEADSSLHHFDSVIYRN